MDASLKEKIKKFYGRFSEPVAIIDSEFVCVYTNSPKLISQGSSIFSFLSKPTILPDDRTTVTLAVINGVSYAVRIIPFEEGLYVCELFERDTILLMAENTNIFESLFSSTDRYKRKMAELRKELNILESRLENDRCGDYDDYVLELRKSLSALESISSNACEYFNMLFHTPSRISYIELTTMATGIVGRCNTILARSERYVDILTEPGEIYIKSDSRFVLCALVNAIQNSLLYSPRDCTPQFTITRQGSDKSKVLLRFTNDNRMFVEDDFDGNTGKNFTHQRAGYGIPIIKRFAELSGGSFSMEEHNGKVIVDIIIPALDGLAAADKKAVLKSNFYVNYSTDIPDILDIKMQEVNDFFTEDIVFS